MAVTVTKACARCGTEFDYVPAKQSRKIYCGNKCRDRASYERLGADNQRNNTFRHKYGITLTERDTKRSAQEFRCAICNRHEEEVGVLVVDHNHATGAVREMLCGSCNRGIGLLQDSPDVAMSAAAYLIQHGEAEA